MRLFLLILVTLMRGVTVGCKIILQSIQTVGLRSGRLRLVKRFIAMPLGLGILAFMLLLIIQTAPVARADGPFFLDWDAVDWPDPGQPPWTTSQTFPIAGTGGSITISFDIDQNCIPVLTPPGLDDNLRFSGGTVPQEESLAIILQYDLAACSQQFTDVNIIFNNMTGVTATVPIYDLDRTDGDLRTDRVEISATDGVNIYGADHISSTFTVGPAMFYDPPSAFQGSSQNQPDTGPNGNLFVTFNQRGLQSITFRYTNPVNGFAQGIGLGDLVFFADVVDLEVDKTVTPTDAVVGQVVTFEITLTNQGPDNATGVEVLDPLPSGYTFASASPSHGSYDEGTGLWTVGDLAAGDSAILTIRARVNASGDYTNCAEVENSDQFDPDSTPGNGCGNGEDDEASVSINLPAPPAEADLAINKISQPRPLAVGDAITYTIVVTNFGPSAVDGVIITDNLPAPVQNPIYTPSSGSFDPSTGQWDIFLDQNDEATLTIVGNLDPNFVGDLQNIASVTSTEGIPDPNDSNNEEPDTNLVILVDPVLTKQISVNQASLGDQVIFRVIMSNPITSTANATQVVLTDPLPLLVTLNDYSFSSSPSGLVTADEERQETVPAPSNSAGITETVRYTVILTAPVMPPGSQVDLIMTTTVNVLADPGPRDIINVATMEFAEGTRVAQAELTVPAPVPPGGGGDDDDDDDDDDGDRVPSPTPTAQSSAPPSATQPEELTLPVAFLPETGLLEATGQFSDGAIGITLIGLGVLGGFGAVAFYIWRGLRKSK